MRYLNKKYLISKSFFLFLIIYPSFHYILKYTSSGTSPTYGNVPLSWQVIKYIILFLYSMLFLFNFSFYKKLNKIIILLIFLFLPVVFYNILLVFIKHPNINELKYIFIFLIMLPILFLDKCSLFLFKKSFEEIIDFIMIYFILTNIYVIFNFLVFNRLPAQAYPGTLMIRFAGLWDMPNAFGFFNSFLLYISLLKKYRIRSIFLFINVILTLSFSSIFVLLLVFSIYLYRKRRLLFAIIFISPFIVLLLIYYFDFLYNIFKLKEGSIMVHLQYFETYPFLSILNGYIAFNESFIQSFLYNYFPFSMFLLIIFLYIGFSNIDSIYGIYIILFVFANIIIPQIYIFPVNVFFVIFLYILLNSNYKFVKDNLW